jgi:hypothetical protein
MSRLLQYIKYRIDRNHRIRIKIKHAQNNIKYDEYDEYDHLLITIVTSDMSDRKF